MRCVEGTDQQDAVVKPLGRLMKVEGRLLVIAVVNRVSEAAMEDRKTQGYF